MIRAIIGALGALTVLVPDRIVAAFERVAVENSDDVEPRRGTRPTLRAEGVAVVALALIGGRAYALAMYVTSAFGTVLLVVPRAYRAIAPRLLYEDPDAVEWRPGFDTFLRLVGAAYVLLGVRELRRDRDAE
ncbi:hypothetical protein C465_11783 [Halorubrum distributum JCM 9100]|uniref:DoxX family protein n=3 Tax=Halorubrum distributum TaxID=29283 RepID=M0EH27_9EURY|nr:MULTISPECIES: hypothetical protein [Halorubrum distributum group]ELZ29450.1 hypothetical protein C473_14317 [Halorubrum terrestre JCM 10247]ELZ47040.1 hypothetical protein C465_11783 [Halorubrum distributum JCM 9100]ELZ55604.1 hypothetical protein C466_05233 [Halorubrum distributum JCM 10118]